MAILLSLLYGGGGEVWKPEGGQMATLVSLLYGGGGEVWKPEGNWYILLTTTLWIEVCIINFSCHRPLSLWNVLRV